MMRDPTQEFLRSIVVLGGKYAKNLTKEIVAIHQF